MLDQAESWVLGNPLGTAGALSLAAIIIGFFTLQRGRRHDHPQDHRQSEMAETISATHPRC